MGNKEFIITLTLDEGTIVFESLSELPFKYVYELIGKINRQTNEKIHNSFDKKMLFHYTFNNEELEFILRAISQMPFNKVYALVENISSQINEQSMIDNS